MNDYLSASTEKRASNFESIQSKYPGKVSALLNMLIEVPYFYREDNENLFMFLRTHHHGFESFFEKNFGWQLILDSKCARVFKDKWYNDKIPASRRNMFNFTKRDECIAFMLLLEFFEQKLEAESISIEDTDNLRFRFGDLLEHMYFRFQKLYPEKAEDYTADNIRSKILMTVIPQLEKYRFLLKIKPPPDEDISSEETIYEALPALYHYDVINLSKPISEMSCTDIEPQTGESEDASE